MQGRASDPAAWPEPFRIAGAARPGLHDRGGGHFVREAA
jgi:peptide/nickel transport system ATP-binding protein